MHWRTILWSLRAQVGPALVWVSALGLAWWLYQDLGPRGRMVGYMQTTSVAIGGVTSARVDQVKVVLGQSVAAGDVVAVLSTADLDTELASVAAEIAKLAAEHAAAQGEARRLAEGQARDHVIQLEEAEAALAAASARARSAVAESLAH